MIVDRRGAMRLGLAFAVGGASIARATSYRIPEYYLYFDSNSAALSEGASQVIQAAKAFFDAVSNDPDGQVEPGAKSSAASMARNWRQEDKSLPVAVPNAPRMPCEPWAFLRPG
jgi:hypothetical protein